MPILPILAGLLIGGRPDAPPPAPTEAEPPARVETELPAVAADGRPSLPACVAGPDGSVLLVWESRGEGGGRADILFSRRGPGGDGRWLPAPVRLGADSSGPSRSLEPRIAVGEAGTVHVAWQDARDGKDDIRVTRSTDGGRTWSTADLRVDGDAPGAAVSSMPALAADGRGRVYLAWEDQRNGDRDIYFARSTDGGKTFEPDLRVDADEPGAGVSYHPDLLCWDDGTVLVFWRDERDGRADVYVRRSRDAGETWEEPDRRLDRLGSPGSTASMHLGVAAVGKRVAAVWDEGGAEVRACFSTDAGERWTPPARVAGDLLHDPLEAAAAGRGVIPAAALTGSRLLWAGTAPPRIWSVLSDGELRVRQRGGPAYRVATEPGGEAGSSRRPTGLAGAGLPGGGLFLAWVRETDAGPRLETVILPGESR